MSRVVVITGPSGVGKGTLIRLLREQLPELGLSISATTRDARPGEADGVDYHFLGDAEFDRLVEDGAFVEHAEYAGRRYGTLRSELERRTAAGEPVVLEIEVQGARQIRDAIPGALLVFIAPPSREALRERPSFSGISDPSTTPTPNPPNTRSPRTRPATRLRSRPACPESSSSRALPGSARAR